MLRQIVYQSESCILNSDKILQEIVDESIAFNQSNNITGILIYDGSHFFQVIEAIDVVAYELLNRIKQDKRHRGLIVIRDNVVNERAFENWSLRALEIDLGSNAGYWVPDNFGLKRDSIIFRVINSFATGRWKSRREPRHPPEYPLNYTLNDIQTNKECIDGFCFAYQPIVDTVTGKISSVEALLRDKDGLFPVQYYQMEDKSRLYKFDLDSKSVAIKNVAPFLPPGCAISVNLLPGALTKIIDSANILKRIVKESGLQPYKVIIELTESEVIDNYDSLIGVVDDLRSYGIRFAIDDFGSGYAGLSLLAKFLPDKIKLDRELVTDIHADGIRQAIIKSLIEFSISIGIPLIAEGVEKYDDWCWLSAQGINRFQGYLLARPSLSEIPKVNWKDISAPSSNA